jgi:hypothetical protein
MRKPLLALILIFATTLSATAQQISPQLPKNSWARVQTVSTGTAIHVKTATSNVLCTLKSADAETLTCAHNFQDLVYKRTEIRSIKVGHRTRSAWVAEGIAFVGFAAASAAVNSRGNGLNNLGAGLVVGFVGLLSLIVAPIVGYFTDFTRGTIYEAP